VIHGHARNAKAYGQAASGIPYAYAADQFAFLLDAGASGRPLPIDGRGAGSEGFRTHYSRPYFVMELVRGIRITNYCDQNHLGIRERLNLFIKMCQAIQHAHQNGIIHRDIKPSNILVTLHDGVPVVNVIDFVIAKATEGQLTDNPVYTQLHQFIGTPGYMSPEQAGRISGCYCSHLKGLSVGLSRFQIGAP